MLRLFERSKTFARWPVAVTFGLAVFAGSLTLAQTALDGLLGRLLEIQQNEAASPQELQEATGLVARIVEEFPSSAAAVSIIRGEPFDGIDFSSFEARLQAAPPQAAPAPVPAPAGQLPTFFAAGETAPAPSSECISAAFSPSAETAMRLSISLLPDGAIEGLPSLVMPDAPDQAVRGDYIGLIGAIEGCAPLGWGAAGDYVLAVTETGTMTIEPPAEPAQIAAAPAAGEAAPGVAPAFPTFQVDPQAPAAQGDAPAAPLPTFLAPAAIPLATPETEDLMALDRQAIRDIQARLLVSGFDPNGVDGVLGRGARAALTNWQASVGVEPSGYMNPQQMDLLRQQSQAQLELWLAEPGNAARYKPPAAAPRAQRKKKRVRVCNRNALGILYNCRYVLR